jgi:hypothetical protein
MQTDQRLTIGDTSIQICISRQRLFAMNVCGLERQGKEISLRLDTKNSFPSVSFGSDTRRGARNEVYRLRKATPYPRTSGRLSSDSPRGLKTGFA